MRFLMLLFLVAGCAGAGWWWWTTTPQYAVQQVKEAVKEHNLQKFNKYVDLDSTSQRMVDDFLAKPMRKAMGGSVVGNVLVSGLVGLLKPRLAAGIKQEITNYVETGNFKSDQPDDSMAPPGVSLQAADEHFGFRRHALKGIESVQTDGGLAKVVLLFHNETYNQDLTLDVNMRKVESYWQVIELANFPQFCGKLAQLEAEQHTGAEPQSTDPPKTNGI